MKLNSISNTKVSDSEGKLKALKEFPSDSTSKRDVKFTNTSEESLEREWSLNSPWCLTEKKADKRDQWD